MIGRTLSHYKVLEEISRGGMGIVYKALDLKLNREVALKVLPPELVSDPDRKRRFVQEAQAAAALKHPNIAVVHEIDDVDGETFIAMELIEGEKLSDVLDRGPLRLERVLSIALGIAQGLAKAHEKGILHRDIKPANVMITEDGSVKIIDFGLAKLVEPVGSGESLVETAIRDDTGAGTLLGTLSYMSPEQARGLPVDHRSDIFSFGTLLFEMISGNNPFASDTTADTLSAILNRAPPRLGASLPKSVRAAVRRCLAKDPDERFQSAAELVNALHRGEKTRPGTGGLIGRVAAVIGLVAIVMTGTWWLSTRDRPLPRSTDNVLSVLVADIDNRTGESVFDGALEQAIAIGLEAAPFITAFDRSRARRQSASLSPESAGKLDEDMARLVCQSQGIELAIVGRMESTGAGYLLHVAALDPVSGETLAEASETASDKAGVLRAVDRVALELRGDLGDVDPGSRRAFDEETFTTASLEAMHAYALGQDLIHAGRYEDAIAEFEKAVGFDPEFGRAFSGMGVALRNLDRPEEALVHFDEALALIHRMSDRERLRTRGVYYLMTRNYAQAADEFEQLVAAFPSDRTGFANLALAQFYRREFAAALETGRRSAEMEPTPLRRLNAAIYATYAGELDVAIEEATAIIAENAAFENAYVALAQARHARGELDGAIDVYRKLGERSARGASLSAMGLADIALYRGKLAEAESLLEDSLAGDLKRQDNFAAAQKISALAEIHFARGNAAVALETSERALSLLGDDVGIRFRAGIMRLNAGERAGALAMADSLEATDDPESRALAQLVRAQAALSQGDPRTAIETVLAVRETVDLWLGRLVLARAYLESGAFAEANSELDTCLRRRGEATALFLDDVPTFRVVADLHYFLGVSQEGLGSKVGAARSYREFLDIKANAAPNDRILDAKRRSAALSGDSR